jgi:hypothetical protein
MHNRIGLPATAPPIPTVIGNGKHLPGAPSASATKDLGAGLIAHRREWVIRGCPCKLPFHFSANITVSSDPAASCALETPRVEQSKSLPEVRQRRRELPTRSARLSPACSRIMRSAEAQEGARSAHANQQRAKAFLTPDEGEHAT